MNTHTQKQYEISALISVLQSQLTAKFIFLNPGCLISLYFHIFYTLLFKVTEKRIKLALDTI
jgi:hypothetical protein